MEIVFFDAFALPFMARALAALAILALAAGVVGLGISFRELEFLSDGLVHAVFPGLVIGWAVGGAAGLLPGAALAALIAGVLFVLLGGMGRGGRAADGDATIAVVLTGLFSLGVVLVSRQEGYVAQLQALLFGQLLTVSQSQFWQLVVVALLALAIMVFTLRAQLFRAFDPAGFDAAGFNPRRTDLALTVAVALLTVAGVQALGVLMVIALLTVPMAVARLLSRSFWLLIPVAILVPLIAGVGGLWLSFDWSVRTGLTVSPSALVVLLLVGLYAAAVLAAFIARPRPLPRLETGGSQGDWP